jgi:hypothetical protein
MQSLLGLPLSVLPTFDEDCSLLISIDQESPGNRGRFCRGGSGSSKVLENRDLAPNLPY